MTLHEALSLDQEIWEEGKIVPHYRRWRRRAWQNPHAWISAADPLGRLRDWRWGPPDIFRQDLLADDWEEFHGERV